MTQSSTFVRGLWGLDSFPIRHMIEREVRAAVEHSIPVLPTLWCCFGQNNRDFLRGLGVEPVMLSDDPVPTYGRTEPTRHDGHAVTNGVSMWTLKYECLRHALRQHHDAIWLDCDTLPEKPIPDYYWERMRAGRPFQCALQQNSCKWAGWRGADNEPRKTPCGSLVYFRGLDVVERFVALYWQRPFEWDLAALARFVDELWGGWQGSQNYKAAGFEPFGHQCGRQVHQPDEIIFRSGWRKGLRAVGATR